MHEQPRLNQFLICMLGNEMYNPGMVLHLFKISPKNKLFCVCRYTYYCSGYLGLGKKKKSALKWFCLTLSASGRILSVPCRAAWPRQQHRALHNCCTTAASLHGGTALTPPQPCRETSGQLLLSQHPEGRPRSPPHKDPKKGIRN